MDNKHSKKLLQVEELLMNPVIEEAIKSRPHNNFESEEHYKARIKAQMAEAFKQFEESIIKGFEIIRNHNLMPPHERLIAGFKIIEDTNAFEHELVAGKTMKEILSFTKEEMLSFYDLGCELFNKTYYVDAANLFMLLCQLNPTISAFWTGLGAVEERQGDYNTAVQAYLFAAELDEHSLSSYLHAARAYLFMNQIETAKQTLQRALNRVQENPLLKEHEEKVNLMLKAIP